MKRIVLLIVLFVTSNAWAIDPECDIPDPGVTLKNAIATGGFQYCTPKVSDTGLTYPETGYPMSCEVFSPATALLPAVVIHTVTDKGPGQLVNVDCPSCRFAYDINIACTNANGTGQPWVGVVMFPGEAPGKPFVQ